MEEFLPPPPPNLARLHKHPLSGADDESYWARRMKNRCLPGVQQVAGWPLEGTGGLAYRAPPILGHKSYLRSSGLLSTSPAQALRRWSVYRYQPFTAHNAAAGEESAPQPPPQHCHGSISGSRGESHLSGLSFNCLRHAEMCSPQSVSQRHTWSMKRGIQTQNCLQTGATEPALGPACTRAPPKVSYCCSLPKRTRSPGPWYTSTYGPHTFPSEYVATGGTVPIGPRPKCKANTDLFLTVVEQ